MHNYRTPNQWMKEEKNLSRKVQQTGEMSVCVLWMSRNASAQPFSWFYLILSGCMASMSEVHSSNYLLATAKNWTWMRQTDWCTMGTMAAFWNIHHFYRTHCWNWILLSQRNMFLLHKWERKNCRGRILKKQKIWKENKTRGAQQSHRCPLRVRDYDCYFIIVATNLSISSCFVLLHTDEKVWRKCVLLPNSNRPDRR